MWRIELKPGNTLSPTKTRSSITVSPPGRAILEDGPKRAIRRTIHAMLSTPPEATLIKSDTP